MERFLCAMWNRWNCSAKASIGTQNQMVSEMYCVQALQGNESHQPAPHRCPALCAHLHHWLGFASDYISEILGSWPLTLKLPAWNSWVLLNCVPVTLKTIHQTCTTWECHPNESSSHFDDLVQWYCAIMIWPKAFLDRCIQFKVKGTDCTPFFQFLFWSGKFGLVLTMQ